MKNMKLIFGQQIIKKGEILDYWKKANFGKRQILNIIQMEITKQQK